MAIRCVASAKLALPTILRSVFHSGVPRDLRTSPVRHLVRLPSKPQHVRPFSSTIRFSQTQKEQSQDVISELTSHTAQPSTKAEPGTAGSDAASHDTASASPTEATKEIRATLKKKKGRKDSDGKKEADKAGKVPKGKQKKKREAWQIQKEALEKKFPAGWNPPKKLSPDALEGIRHLHATAPERFTTAVLAEEFKVSPEAIRRILKSRWTPSEEEMESRRQRWERRHERIWSQMAELGLRPPTERSRALMDSNTLYGKDKK